MLTLTDVPEQILEFYKKSKLTAAAIVGGITGKFPSRAIDAQTDLCGAYPASLIVVRNGMFKYCIKEKFIRFYSTGDIITTPQRELSEGVSIWNEFGAEVCVVPQADFIGLVTAREEFLQQWFSYQQASDYIMHVLCSLYVKEEFEPHSEMRQYQPGEAIINEGDGPDYLFEMIEGSASVTVRGTEIGAVNEGEVFGEVSFLTGSPRGATVMATARCLVQAVRRPDLERFARHRPGLMYKLSQTLAYRLNEVNKRLVSISSLT